MKIQKIEAENFKLFTSNFDKIQDIADSDMILFNGPNGYGKTSVFDIIEFCLTGDIKRISDYSDELAIAKNERFENKILIADESKKSFVKLVLEDDNKEIEICYCYSPSEKRKGVSKENNPHYIFDCFTRTIKCNGETIENEEEYFKSLQLYDIKEIFDKCCFLSQDEHLQFLKTTKKSKAEALAFLFDVPEKWKKEQEKVSNQLDILANKKKKNCYLRELECEEKIKNDEIEKLESKINKLNKESNIIYEKLFNDKEIFWDKENVEFDDISYLNAKQDLDNLLYFAEHKKDCINYNFNRPYENLVQEYNSNPNISYKENPLQYSYMFISLIKQEQDLEEKYRMGKIAGSILQNIQDKHYENLNWTYIKEREWLNVDEIEIIKKQLDLIEKLKKTQGIIQKAMTSLRQSRDNLIRNASEAMDNGVISSNNCPLCGEPFSDRIELDRKIKEETQLLGQLSDNSVIQIEDIIKDIYNNYLKRVEKIFLEILVNSVTDETYQRLQDAKKYKIQILEVEHILEKIGISMNRNVNDSIEDGYNNLLTKLKESLIDVSEEVKIQLGRRKFIDYYDRFFDKEEHNFISIDIEKFKKKKMYIENLHYNFYIDEMSKRKNELSNVQTRINKLNSIIKGLQAYQDALKAGIQEYKKKIISDIEPLLHIYTAKILQQKFNGKSIYIHSSENVQDIQFVNSAQDNQDILYSMSSGQLSAVALSFLLCMNQAYGADKACSILLIDDPVQTIDDVNMVGFVDILRYEFGDRQIFISTHEQSFEWFLRYRYSKAEKKVNVFNMKDIMLQE